MTNFDDIFNNTTTETQGTQYSKEEYAAMKKAEREELYSLSDRTAMEVAGDSGRFKQYLDTQARFGRYSVVNTLLIMAQKPEAKQVADLEYWNSKGSAAKKGEKAFAILVPYDYEKDDGTTGYGFNAKKVFDISQMDADEVKSVPAQTYDNRQILTALVDKAPVKITAVDELPGDFGAVTNPDTGEIQVRKGMEFADIFRSVAQELARADLATSPDTQVNSDFSAYCASYILCKTHGVDTREFNFEGACEVLGGMDAREIKGELSQIRDTANNISGRMAQQLRAMNAPARNTEAR